MEIDRAEAVRPGEELPMDALGVYLRARLPHLEGTLTVEQFPRGYSNLTYLLRWGEYELVLRRPPFGAQVATAHDMGREYRVLRGLARVHAKTPRPLLYCEDASIIGAPFYVMERLTGVVLRAGQRPATGLTPAFMAALSVAAVDNLAAIHALDCQAAGLADLGKPAGYVQRQLQGWTQRYRNAQTDDLRNVDEALAWLAGHVPPEQGAALIHNDYKYDNLVLDPHQPARILGVLDWEMCTLGDPLMDLGTTLGYWIEADDPPALSRMFGLTALPGNLNRRQVVERYAEASGRNVPDPLFYFVYGVSKIAVIIQQIYYRYVRGQTRDARFAGLGEVVAGCGQMAAMAIEKGRIDRLGTE